MQQNNAIETLEENGSIKRAIEWGAELATEIRHDLEDGNISFWEGIGLADNSLQLIGIVKEFKKIPDDWNVLRQSETYKNAIIKGMQSKLGVGSEIAEKIVLQAVVTGIEISKFIHLCVDARKKA